MSLYILEIELVTYYIHADLPIFQGTHGNDSEYHSGSDRYTTPHIKDSIHLKLMHFEFLS